MAEFQPVPIGRPTPRSWLPALGSVLALILALAVVKPWQPPESGDPNLDAASPSAVAISSLAPTPRSDRHTYDPRLFGNREPDPAWELWPAGYVVQFGMAGPVVVHGQESPEPSGAPAESPTPTTPPDVPVPSSGPEHVVDLGPADHLIALGINTPAHIRVDAVHLWAEGRQACFCVEIPIVRLPTLWESDHFIVIGIADPERPGDTGPWIPGEYRLELETASGETRSVRLRVLAPAN